MASREGGWRAPHPRRRPHPVGISGGARPRFCVAAGRPGARHPGSVAACRRAEDARGPWPLPHRVAPRLASQRPPSQPGSAHACGEVPTRLPRRMGAPQGGPQATSGGGGRVCGGVPGRAPAGRSIRQRGAGGRAPRAGRKPQWRPGLPPSGTTGGRKRRRNAMASRGAVRGRGRPPGREGHVTGRSWRLPRRGGALAPLQPAGAREGQAGWPWGCA
jgi:hypothetical protein